jgi:hypothetical protein
LNELLNSKSEGNDYEYLKKAKENLEKARNKIVTIIPFATDEKRRVFEFLSPEQNQYWQQ